MAELGSVVRLNPNKFNAISFSFILDKELQLIKAPVAYPIVEPLASPLFSYSFEVFHHNLVSIEIGNNTFADVMVNPSHITSFSSTNLPEKTLSGSSAFSLKNRTQILELPFNLFDFEEIIKPCVTSDGKVVYSTVNTKNSILDIRAFGINHFGECEQKEASAFLIHSQETFTDLPIYEVLPITIGNVKVEGFSLIDCSNCESTGFQPSTSWEVVSDACSVDCGFALGFLDHSTCLLNTSHSKLSRKLKLFSEVFVDYVMEFDVIPYFVLPSCINTELQGFSISFNGSNYFRCWRNLDFCCCSDVHNGREMVKVIKSFENEEDLAVHHHNKIAVSPCQMTL